MEVSVSLYHFRVNIFAIGPLDSAAVRCRSDKILLGVTTCLREHASCMTVKNKERPVCTKPTRKTRTGHLQNGNHVYQQV